MTHTIVFPDPRHNTERLTGKQQSRMFEVLEDGTMKCTETGERFDTAEVLCAWYESRNVEGA